MAEYESDKSRRSSSQTSDASTASKKARALRSRRPKSHSTLSSTPPHKQDPSLTSFPSLSPGQVGNQNGVTKGQNMPQPSRTTSQKVRDRKATLVGLTSVSQSLHGRSSLFDESPRPSLNIPGAIHLGSDEHIQRLIGRTGAVNLVRQYAQDLAQRDAEISALRVRADERERELKKMLREVEVTSADIERRLHMLENAQSDNGELHDSRPAISRKPTSGIDEMMHQAMSEEVGLSEEESANVEAKDLLATIKPVKNKLDRSAKSVVQSRSRSGSIQGWQVWFGNSKASSRNTSRSSSIIAEGIRDASVTGKPAKTISSSSERTGLESLFKAPAQAQSSSYFIGGANKVLKNPSASVHSKTSGGSLDSWARVFSGRPRSNSLAQEGKTSANAAESAMAALSKVKSHSDASSASRPTTSPAQKSTSNARALVRRPPTSSNLSTNPDNVRSDSVSLGPVEMDAILPLESKPPAMQQAGNNYQTEGLLTDRFGFIYDQRQRKRQSQAASLDKKGRVSVGESLGNLRHDFDTEEDNDSKFVPEIRPPTPAPVEDGPAPKRWQDYLKVSKSTRPTELLMHTPSASAIVPVNVPETITANTQPRTRATSLSVSSQRARPTMSEPSQTTVTAQAPESAIGQDHHTTFKTSTPDQEPVKLLLDQLTELHDTLQAEKTVKWNDFLRKVRAERNNTSSSDRVTPNAPEADLLNGELIGIATLGRPSKTNRNKYLQFKALVLAGIAVSLRPKIWAECSGAASLRIPGYYDDLVSRSQGVEPEVALAIRNDARRTLTSNIYFRSGPGLPQLEQILLAFSLHNPQIGYCQGMNTITASMMLVLPDSESVFWLLVAVIDSILPSGYFDKSLLVSRADQLVLRGYVAEVLPKLSGRLEELGVELEAVTFSWFLSLYTSALSGEALYRVWDVVLCLNSSDAPAAANASISSLTGIMLDTASLHRKANSIASTTPDPSTPTTPVTASNPVKDPSVPVEHDGTSSAFLFQISLALLKLNEAAILALDGPAQVYQYIGSSCTNHSISLDALIGASEALRKSGVVRREDVLARRKKAVQELQS